jgi:hypothetical protein
MSINILNIKWSDTNSNWEIQSDSNIFVPANAASDQSRHKDVWNALYKRSVI